MFLLGPIFGPEDIYKPLPHAILLSRLPRPRSRPPLYLYDPVPHKRTFCSRCSPSLAILVPFVSALTLNAPSGLSSGGPATITWTSESTDPPFSIELVNTVFHNSFAIANNVNPTLNSMTIALPIVPVGDGYTLEAVNVTSVEIAWYWLPCNSSFFQEHQPGLCY
ncbi:hypothetical protein OE88DRAFT_60676 [Heliocybe sulcata]|uniref:Uncharacterized protein n=1 Tax=Heliocybe sulcata TaxID=5364 RepID=A0A5C3NIU8_9AGAM|nr:hypothetical protein OE88DRAFT_60676 [Heliocybe sulcata]